MCGRYTIASARDVLSRFLDREIPVEIPLPVYNASPGQYLPVVLDAEPGKIVSALWGIRPWWSDDAPGRLLINARAETVHRKPAFRESFRERRCLVVADGFYEWKQTQDGKQPYRVTLTNGEPFTFAGIWMEVDGAVSYLILTTEPNRVTRPIHNRMPVMLEKQEQVPWLDRGLAAGEVLRLLDPYPENAMKAYPVTRAVNSSRNEGPELIEPLADPGRHQP